MAIIHIRLFGAVCSDPVIISDENNEDISLSFVMKVKDNNEHIRYRVVINDRDLISKWKESFASGAYVVARGIMNLTFHNIFPLPSSSSKEVMLNPVITSDMIVMADDLAVIWCESDMKPSADTCCKQETSYADVHAGLIGSSYLDDELPF